MTFHLLRGSPTTPPEKEHMETRKSFIPPSATNQPTNHAVCLCQLRRAFHFNLMSNLYLSKQYKQRCSSHCDIWG